MHPELGLAGRLARRFLTSAITPLLAVVGLLLGLAAVGITPKEEEPQIEVTFADIYIPFPGATPAQVEQLVTTPAEQVISALSDIDTLYSFSQPGGALLIVAFEVGTPRQQALVELHNQLLANRDWLPQGIGVGAPLIKPRRIDDVPVLALTLWSKETRFSGQELTTIAHGLETELKQIAGTNAVTTLGGHNLTVRVTIDPARLNAFDVDWPQLVSALTAAGLAHEPVGLTQRNEQIAVRVGGFLQSGDEVGELVVASHDGTPVYLADVADIRLMADEPQASVWHQVGSQVVPAVTLTVAKQPGVNAATLTSTIGARLEATRHILIPDGVELTVSRDYGESAAAKADTLVLKLCFATAAVVLLVWLAMGWRAAAVVGATIAITLALTLFASWAWGFTLNRISLFALIFAIGILVDDAIVVVENIHRHGLGDDWQLRVPGAVDEVGGPTILATFTVIAALLPMAFVSGLMGPYMSPIPINASTGMLISLAVAFVITPWLAVRWLPRHQPHGAGVLATPVNEEPLALQDDGDEQPDHDILFSRPERERPLAPQPPLLDLWLARSGELLVPFIRHHNRRANRRWLGIGVAIAITLSLLLPVAGLVVLKMLPFDDKSELQLLVDLPEGTPLEQTQRLLFAMADKIAAEVPEVAHQQIYAGLSGPITFNGLVRHYELRRSANLGDLQINLLSKGERERSSHELALAIRPLVAELAAAAGAVVKVVEVPPGPPVWAPIVAEVYGPSADHRQQAAEQLRQLMLTTPGLVDVDIDLPAAQTQWQVTVDRARAARLGISEQAIVQTVHGALAGQDVTWLHPHGQKYPLPVRLKVSNAAQVDLDGILSLRLTAANGARVALEELVQVERGTIATPIVHKNMRPLVMVTADMAGDNDSPLYGMFSVLGRLAETGSQWPQQLVDQPSGIDGVAVLWSGEWQITYETFRDMGIAYGAGMLLIYLLVVAWFRSYLVPLVIMAPIPLTIIGVMPGHALFGAQFTATSMIGMIALAGIIVRNSILLVDVINDQLRAGVALMDAVVGSVVLRARPILLTALAAMLGALFILSDPIFNGLAISLLFGIAVSTVLTLVVIPVLYYLLLCWQQGGEPEADPAPPAAVAAEEVMDAEAEAPAADHSEQAPDAGDEPQPRP